MWCVRVLCRWLAQWLFGGAVDDAVLVVGGLVCSPQVAVGECGLDYDRLQVSAAAHHSGSGADQQH
jgi:Tat protein secretion system quality control protein TatD with DNase activity